MYFAYCTCAEKVATLLRLAMRSCQSVLDVLGLCLKVATSELELPKMIICDFRGGAAKVYFRTPCVALVLKSCDIRFGDCGQLPAPPKRMQSEMVNPKRGTPTNDCAPASLWPIACGMLKPYYTSMAMTTERLCENCWNAARQRRSKRNLTEKATLRPWKTREACRRWTTEEHTELRGGNKTDTVKSCVTLPHVFPLSSSDGLSLRCCAPSRDPSGWGLAATAGLKAG